MKEKKRWITWILAVVLTAGLIGCGTEKKDDHEHEWNPITGTCKICDTEHSHEWNEKGQCTVCKYTCTHKEHDKESLLCTTCGTKVEHDFTDGKCNRCDATTVFEYKEVDASYAEPCEQKGTITELYYDTYSYAIEQAAGVEHGTIPVNKRARQDFTL